MIKSLGYPIKRGLKQATVNRLAGGSNPSRGAILRLIACWRGLDFVQRLVRTSIAQFEHRLLYPQLQAQDRLELLIQFVFLELLMGIYVKQLTLFA